MEYPTINPASGLNMWSEESPWDTGGNLYGCVSFPTSSFD